MFNMKLQICLLPEVPGTGCAAKQLFLIAVLHCQMHLNERRPKKEAIHCKHLQCFGKNNKLQEIIGGRGFYLYGHLGVKDLLTEGTVVQDKRVHVQEVFLQIVH